MGDLTEFKGEVSNCIDIIFEKFQRKANRLAFITTHIINEIDQEEFSLFFNKIFNPIPTYKDNDTTQWRLKMVSRISKEFNERTELHNFITDINRIKSKLNINSTIEKLDRLQIKIDINTFQGNSDFRFDVDDMKGYFVEVINWENKLREEIYTLIKS